MEEEQVSTYSLTSCLRNGLFFIFSGYIQTFNATWGMQECKTGVNMCLQTYQLYTYTETLFWSVISTQCCVVYSNNANTCFRTVRAHRCSQQSYNQQVFSLVLLLKCNSKDNLRYHQSLILTLSIKNNNCL